MSDDGRGSGNRPALSRCIAVAPDRFAAEYWGSRPLLSRSADLGEDFSDLFSTDAVDELISGRALRTPFIRMAREGTVLAPSRFTASGGFGAEIGDQVSSEKVLQEFEDGSTIVLQGLHRTWQPLADFTRQLVADLGHPCQVNAYITPASSRGFDPHYDVHDVFVIQVAGDKHWTIHEPVHPDPLRDQPWTDHRDAVAARATGSPAIDATFHPGDVLYLPRGWIHSATALGGVSVHLTIGVAAYTRADVVQRVIARASDDAKVRSSLPLGIDFDDPAQLASIVQETADALLVQLREAATDARTAADVARTLAARLRDDTRPEPVRPLSAVHAAESLDGDTIVQVRQGLAAHSSVDGERVCIQLPDKTVKLPVAARAAVELLLDAGRVRVADLPGLDVDSAVVVARRLVREGVLAVR
ncbi:cupin domain-containing protein [Diaminobutyricibacter sp. McL0618]|uniref:cupin domain-containing protein n=1 Tax=Leifsonia sp. McL0618 TaxID=3415677 RepID=UPI003CE93134